MSANKLNTLKVGKHALINGHPCKVIEINRSEPGKHGHAQYNVYGRDLRTSKKQNELFKHHDHLIPVQVERHTSMGVDLDDKNLIVINDNMEERVDLLLPEELKEKYTSLSDKNDCTVHTTVVTYPVNDGHKSEEFVSNITA